VRLLAAAIFAGLALVAGAVVYETPETRDANPYADAEEIVSAYLSVAGYKAQSVRRVSGPFVVVKLEPRRCILLDVSTQYGGEGVDSFWGAGPSTSDRKSIDC
jgi:hypothetical protein